jgi:hypothetical protein
LITFWVETRTSYNRRHAIIAGFSLPEVCFHEERLSLAEKIGSLRRNVAWRQTVMPHCKKLHSNIHGIKNKYLLLTLVKFE